MLYTAYYPTLHFQLILPIPLSDLFPDPFSSKYFLTLQLTRDFNMFIQFQSISLQSHFHSNSNVSFWETLNSIIISTISPHFKRLHFLLLLFILLPSHQHHERFCLHINEPIHFLEHSYYILSVQNVWLISLVHCLISILYSSVRSVSPKAHFKE